jgi:thiamine kinase-like enzyme
VGLNIAEVLASIDGWAGADVAKLKGGLTNTTWRVDKDGRSGVLKIDARPRAEPYNTRRREAEIQARACEAGLANRVLFANETVYLSEYVEGVVWSQECLEDDANIEQLAGALRRLHALPLSGRLFDAAGAARDYARNIRNPDELKVKTSVRKVEEGPQPFNLCFCHNDLVVGNIINTPETRFLDWEYACDNDPFFDLATVVAHHDLTAAQRDTLLDAYFDGNGSSWREQLSRQAEVYEALLYLWQESRGS